jgi:hypothetical protein
MQKRGSLRWQPLSGRTASTEITRVSYLNPNKVHNERSQPVHLRSLLHTETVHLGFTLDQPFLSAHA